MCALIIRKLKEEDCAIISKAFAAQAWDKPIEQYQRYLTYQEDGSRDILVAALADEFAGYLTIKWEASYLPFKAQGIPEIVDFNVLQKFQRKGIGTALMDEAERRMKIVSTIAGIGVGITKDYGAAQILYIKRGYIPDGNGLLKDSISLALGASITIDHSLAFCLTKKL